MSQTTNRQCALLLIADGFDEVMTISTISALREAGLCIKSVGLIGTLVSGAHGVGLKPDLSLSECSQFIADMSVKMVILPEGKQALARLETDPRVHQILRQVVGQDAQIVTNKEGLRVLRAAGVWIVLDGFHHGQPVHLYEPVKSPEMLAQALLRRFQDISTDQV